MGIAISSDIHVRINLNDKLWNNLNHQAYYFDRFRTNQMGSTMPHLTDMQPNRNQSDHFLFRANVAWISTILLNSLQNRWK